MAILCALLLCFGSYFQAQQNDYATNPGWIKMMRDTNTNYQKAVEAYNNFWKEEEKPIENKSVAAVLIV